jgi:CBS domain-containing protein
MENTPVSNILKDKGSQVYAIHPEAKVIEAVRLMNEKKAGALVVVHNHQPVGMFTERDVLIRVVDAGKDPKETLVKDVMTEKVIVIHPETTIEKTMRIISQERCRHLPVLDDDHLVGLISIGDLMRWIVREHETHIDNLLDYIHGRYPG